jgi:hypothetical protein
VKLKIRIAVTNRHLWRQTPFEDYDASAKTIRPVINDGGMFADHR